MGDITQLLSQVADEDGEALDQVFEQLHAELKTLARSRLSRSPSETLTPTALVNELYLKLMEAKRLDLKSRSHFFVCAAGAMRQIVLDAARARHAKKRGGDAFFVTLTEPPGEGEDTDLLALDEALQELEQVDPSLRQLVDLRYFAGLTIEEVAKVRGVSVRSVHRDWARARAFLNMRLQAEP